MRKALRIISKFQVLIFFLISYIILSSKLIFPQQNLFDGKVVSDQTKQSLGNVQVFISNNELTKKTYTDITGRFEFLPDPGFVDPIHLLCQMDGYFTRIFNIPSIRSNSFNLERASYNTTFTLYLYGEVIDGTKNEPVPDVSIYADYGEIPTITDQNGVFKIQIHHPPSKGDNIVLWFEHPKYKPLVMSVINPEQYNNENNQLKVQIELLPTFYHFKLFVRRNDRKERVQNVRVEINDVYFGNTDEDGKLDRYKTFDTKPTTVEAKFSHSSFADTILTIPLISTEIDREVRLNFLSFTVNSLVYYEGNNHIFIGVPETRFELKGKEIGHTDFSGQNTFSFNAIPGEEITVSFPSDMGYSPSDTTIHVMKKNENLNIKVRRSPITLRFIPKEETNSNINISDIDSLKLICNRYVVATQKVENHFVAKSNLFNEGSTLEPILFSKKYRNKDTKIILLRNNAGEYISDLYVERIEKSETKQTAETFQKINGTLVIQTSPDAARISIDDQEKGFTPFRQELPIGKHSIWLKKADYVPSSLVVDIVSDSIVEKFVELEGPITPLQKMSKWKIAVEAGGFNFLMKFPSGSYALFPSPIVGAHFYPTFNPDCGLKISYLASKVPSFYTNQNFYLGLFLGAKRLHWSVGVRESNFESFKRIKARFAGSSAESYISMNLFSEDKSIERLLFLNYYSHAIVAGVERSFKSINKSVEGDFKPEEEFYLGWKWRYKRGMFDFRFSWLFPKLEVIDIEEKPNKNIDVEINRIFFSYHYFLN